MEREFFDRSVPIFVGMGYLTHVGTASRAHALLSDWPIDRRGAAHARALRACRAAMAGELDFEQSLRARVRSYLGGGNDGRVQVPALIERARDVDAVVTPSVKDALLLENELIKRHKPPFNVRLRDDKQYLALRLDDHVFE